MSYPIARGERAARRLRSPLSAVAVAALLAACGGGGGGGSSPAASTQRAGTIQANVTGQSAGKLLVSDGVEALTIAPGMDQVAFNDVHAAGSAYAVKVLVQPAGETCSVSNGSGTMGATAVSGVAVDCAPAAAWTAARTRGVAPGVTHGIQDIAFDAAGSVYMSAANKLYVIGADGSSRVLAGNGTPGLVDGQGAAASLGTIEAVAVAIDGTVYVADTGRIRRVAADGTVTTLAGSDDFVSVDGQGSAASFMHIEGLAVENDALYVLEGGAQASNGAVPDRIRRVDVQDGTVTTLAGSDAVGSDDGVGTAATFQQSSGIAVGPDHAVYVFEYDDISIRRLDPGTRAVTTVYQAPSGWGVNGASLAIGADGTFYLGGSLSLGGSSSADSGVAAISPQGDLSIVSGVLDAQSVGAGDTSWFSGYVVGMGLKADGSLVVVYDSGAIGTITPP